MPLIVSFTSEGPSTTIASHIHGLAWKSPSKEHVEDLFCSHIGLETVRGVVLVKSWPSSSVAATDIAIGDFGTVQVVLTAFLRIWQNLKLNSIFNSWNFVFKSFFRCRVTVFWGVTCKHISYIYLYQVLHTQTVQQTFTTFCTKYQLTFYLEKKYSIFEFVPYCKGISYSFEGLSGPRGLVFVRMKLQSQFAIGLF